MTNYFYGNEYYHANHIDRETCLRAIDILKSGKMNLSVGDIHPTEGVHRSLIKEFTEKYKAIKCIYVT